MIDLHCHLLPGIDDGPKDAETTLAMAALACQDGIRTVAVTHHYTEDQPIQDYLDQIHQAMHLLQVHLRQKDLPLQAVAGAEVLLSPFLSSIKALPQLCIHNSRYLLVELPMAEIPRYTEDALYTLRIKGIVPILAHPERNWAILQNPNRILPLLELGILSQINGGSVTGRFGKRVQRCAKTLLKHRMAHLLASDGHSLRSRPPVLSEARGVLTRWLGPEAAQAMTETVPGAILQDVSLEMPPPIPCKKPFFLP